VPPARILIVDDEEDIADLLGEGLIEAGYEVTLAASGQAALDLAPGVRPDVVNLDMSMPGLSGLEVLTALHRETPRLPVIMISGRSSGPPPHEAFAAIEKPFDLDALKPIVAAAVEQGRTPRR
jgi:DNA-binding NtrC family response regulator